MMMHSEKDFRYKVTFSVREDIGWETKSEQFETKVDAKAFAQSLRSNRKYAAIALTDLDGNPLEGGYSYDRG